MKIEDFEGTGPAFDVAGLFSSRLEGSAIVEGPLGGLQRRATIRGTGSRAADGAIAFSETWRFDDGHVDTLDWTIRPLGEGRYAGAEPKLVGEAEGQEAGCAFHWTYTRDMPDGQGGSTRLNFDDWFFRIDAATVMAKGTSGRLGLPLGTVHVTYRQV